MNTDVPSSNAARGVAHVIYPHYDPTSGMDLLVAVKGNGVRIFDESGRSYLEGVAGLWCASLGFSNERLARIAYEQLRTLPYYPGSSGKTHNTLIDLAEKLLSVAPANMDKVFFASSGSEANDSALKTIWYYNNARGKPEKKKIISRLGAYHGVTYATTSLTGMDYFHRGFDAPLDRFLYVMAPNQYRNGLSNESDEDFATRCASEIEQVILREGPETVAAMFMEPVMSGGGVIVPPRTYGEKIQAVLRRYDVLLVSDEVVCGFGRTGNYWGHQTVGFSPDMISCAKALSAGFMPISALMISKSVADVVLAQAHQLGGFGHNFTYLGHPVAAAVALETLKIYQEMDIVSHIRRSSEKLQQPLRDRFGGHPLIGDIRGIGLVAALEVVADKVTRASFPETLKVARKLQQICQDNGLILRYLPSDTIAICPPFIITEAEIGELLDKLALSLDVLTKAIVGGHA